MWTCTYPYRLKASISNEPIKPALPVMTTSLVAVPLIEAAAKTLVTLLALGRVCTSDYVVPVRLSSVSLLSLSLSLSLLRARALAT